MEKSAFNTTGETGGLVPIGIIGRPRGLNGEVRVRLFDVASRALFVAPTIVLEAPDGARSPARPIGKIRSQGKDLILQFPEATTRSHAEALRGYKILVTREDLPPPDPGEVYDVDLIGAVLYDLQGQALGTIESIDHPPANDVLVVRLQTDRWIDVPMIESVIIEIDVEGKRVVVNLPEGLPDRATP